MTPETGQHAFVQAVRGLVKLVERGEHVDMDDSDLMAVIVALSVLTGRLSEELQRRADLAVEEDEEEEGA